MYSLQTTRPGTYEPMAVQPRQATNASMPLCRYGHWCTRSNCIYQHATRSRAPRTTICLMHLQGQCVHGDNCWYEHPADPSAILSKLSAQRCQYGDHCPHGERCLFGHLRNNDWSGAYSKEFTSTQNDRHPKHAVVRNKKRQNPHQPPHQSTVPQSNPETLHPRVRGRSI